MSRRVVVVGSGVPGSKGNTGTPGTAAATASTFAGLGTPTAGEIRRVTDNVRGLWFADGTRWHPFRPSADVRQFATGGTGTSADPWTGWEAGINALPVGSLIFFGPGYFLGALSNHPENANYKQILRPKSGWTIQGAGRGSTFVRLIPNSESQTASVSVSMVLNNQITAGGDVDITIEDLSFDGNAANQGAGIHGGLNFLRVRGLRCARVNVFNCQGNAPSGFGETVHFTASLSSDCSWTDCSTFTTAGTSGSGFSANSSSNLRWQGCDAWGLSINGFTHNSCAGVTYVNCTAWLNGYYGFNNEVSVDVSYANCRAGGRSAIAAASWPYSANTPLGNQRHGFAAVGPSRRISYVGCQSLGNGTLTAGSYNGFLLQDVHGLAVVGCIGSDDQAVKTQAYGLAFSGSCTAVNAVGNNWDGNLTGKVFGTLTFDEDLTLGHLKLRPTASTGGVEINAQVPAIDLMDINASAEDWRLAVDANQLFAYSFTQGAQIATIDRLKGLLLPLADNGRGVEFHAGPREFSGTGTPEGVVTAPPGSTYRNKSGGAGAAFWVKESGAGNVGWVGK